jgi:hypothetical protein
VDRVRREAVVAAPDPRDGNTVDTLANLDNCHYVT